MTRPPFWRKRRRLCAPACRRKAPPPAAALAAGCRLCALRRVPRPPRRTAPRCLRCGSGPCRSSCCGGAPFFQGAKLLIAADCTAYARADFHQRFMRGRITLIGCPKLDEGDYTEKLTEILRRNDIRELTVVRMEVPCCGGIQRAAENALRQSGKFIPWQVVTLGRDGNILE